MDIDITSLGIAFSFPYISLKEVSPFLDNHISCVDDTCWCRTAKMSMVFSIGEISNLKVKTRRMALQGKPI